MDWESARQTSQAQEQSDLPWFVQLLKSQPHSSHWDRQTNKYVKHTACQILLHTRRLAALRRFFSPTSFLSVLFGCLGIYVSVQLYWILTGALNSYRQYDRLRKNNLNNSIATILLVLINYFWQPYWFCRRAVPLWRFSSVPLWIFSPTQVQSYVWF